MKLHTVAASAYLLLGLAGHGQAVSSDNPLKAPEPVLRSFELDQRFDRVLLIPGSRDALLISTDLGKVVRRNLDESRQGQSFDLHLQSVADMVVEAEGRFAFGIAQGGEEQPSIFRLELSKGTLSIIPLQGISKLTNPKVAIGSGNRLIVAGKGTERLLVVPDDTFDTERSGVTIFAQRPIVNDVPVGDLATLSSEPMVFVSSTIEPTIFALGISTTEKYFLTKLSAAAKPPLALVMVSGAEGRDGKHVPTALVGDQVGSRVMLFDYNTSFRALDFKVEAAVTVVDQGSQAQSIPNTNPLVMAASDALSAIVVGSRQSKRVYFFARKEERVLQLLNMVAQGPIQDLDVGRDGRLAVILANHGRSLIRVDRPDTPGKSSDINAEAQEPVLKAQTKLAELGFLIGAADGQLGRRTKEAISNFQRNQSLPPTGILDSETKSRLEDEQQIGWYRKRAVLEKKFEDQGIRFFKVDDLLGTKTDVCMRSKPFPPPRTWCSAISLAKTMDAFRERWRAPVTIESAFRHRECGDGSENTAYGDFRALDFRSPRGEPAQWVKLLKDMRDENTFEGKVEARNDGFVHLEIEPELLWVSVGKRPKNGKFEGTYFDITQPPKEGKGQKLRRPQPIYLRSAPPQLVKGDVRLGETISILNQNLALSVERTSHIDDKEGNRFFWAGGSVLPTDSGADRALNNWFVVQGTTTTEDEAERRAEKLRKTDTSFSFDVYQVANKLFVVVLGAYLDQSAAKKLVLEAQCAGFPETYMQILEPKTGSFSITH